MRHGRLRRLLPVLMGGGAKTWQQELLTLFPGGSDVGIAYNYDIPTTTTKYWLYKHLYDNRYWRFRLGEAAGSNVSVGQNTPVIGIVDIVDLYKAYNAITDPAIILSGAWTITTNAGYPGGVLYYANVAGRHIEFTGVGTTFGAVCSSSANYIGAAKVLIDGDATLADLLPTAQDLVTSGALANTVLVANGGTLNPTDRIWDQYNTAANYVPYNSATANCTLQLFSSSLSDTSHTVRILVTGYKNVSSSAANVQVFQVFKTGPSVRSSDGGDDAFIPVVIVDTGNTPEISYSFVPTGATTAKWLGHVGQAKIKVSPAFTVDGVAITPADERHYSGSEVILTMTSSIRHSEIDGGATELGEYIVHYKMNKSTGLTISHSVTWATTGTITAYSCMMPVNHSVFDRFKTHGNEEIDLTANDDSVNLNSSEQAAWCWDFNGNLAALMYIPDLAYTVDNWVNADASPRLFWSDISVAGGAWKKAYTTRYKMTAPFKTFADEQVILSECNYRINWFADGANAALAGKF